MYSNRGGMLKMNLKMLKGSLAALGVMVAAAGGLLMATPAAQAAAAAPAVHAAHVAPAFGGCPSGDLEVDYTSGAQCDPSHADHRDPINRCDVLEIDSGGNWVAAWVGPSLSDLSYESVGPSGWINANGAAFCVGDIAVNP